MQTRIIIGIVLIVGIAAYLAYTGFDEGRAYYLTCDEVAADEANLVGDNIRLAGSVVEGTIQRDGDILLFQLEYEGSTYPVRYVGLDPVPDTFKDGVDAVVDGHLTADGHFEGQKIQAKCASKYEADYGTDGEKPAGSTA
jgi:cytochrome c-type biogenesis protein CcmE